MSLLNKKYLILLKILIKSITLCLVYLICSLDILASFFIMLSIKVIILYFLVTLLHLDEKFLLRLYIFIVFNGFFEVALIKVVIAKCFLFYIVDKIDVLVFVYV